MAFKMKHLGGSPLHDHRAGHYSDWRNTGESRTTTTRGTQKGRTGTITTIEQDQSRKKYFDKDPVVRQKQKQWIKDNPKKYKELLEKRNTRTLTSTSFRPDLEKTVSIKPQGINIKPSTPTADVNIKRPTRETKKIIPPTPRKKRKKRRTPPDLVPNLRPVGDAIGAIGSAIGRSAENVVNNLFGARSIFRICKKCK
tara:strand:- start:138 stop:728 length:591 start_codon:yes stop_codon:yes gene_type:complete